VKELIERLRQKAGQYDEYDWHSVTELEAADALERLTAERDEYRSWGLQNEASFSAEIADLTAEYVRQRALLVRARNLLSQPAHWGADDEHIKSRYALYTEIQEHLSGMSGEKK
jgi:hypothetical protein